MRRLLRDENGAEAVELALVFPVFIFLLLVSMQMVFIGLARYGVKYVARDAARYLAVRPDTTDAALLTRIQSTLLLGMDASHIVSVTTTAACASLTAGHCASRKSGDVITVAFVYDTSGDYFVPANFGIGNLTFSVGSTQNSSQVSMVIE